MNRDLLYLYKGTGSGDSVWLTRANRAKSEREWWEAVRRRDGDNMDNPSYQYRIDGRPVPSMSMCSLTMPALHAFLGMTCQTRTTSSWIRIWKRVEDKCRAYASRLGVGDEPVGTVVSSDSIGYMRSILDAMESGRTVQWYDGHSWHDLPPGSLPNFGHLSYRVCPSSGDGSGSAGECVWRPFRDLGELGEAIESRGCWVVNRHNGVRCQVVAYGRESLLVGESTKTYGEFFENCEFLDGTPCGVREGDA